MNDDVDRAVKKARKVIAGELQDEIQTRHNATLVGNEYDVLVEGRKRGRLHGRNRGDRLIYLNEPVETGQGLLKRVELLAGETVRVEITESSPWSLEAELTEVQPGVKKEKVPVV
jgi:tRNA A37 methylthiotransferase MiaB